MGKGCRGLLDSLLLLTTGAILMLIVVSLASVGRSKGRWFQELGATFNPPAPAQVDVRSIVIRQVRGASDLTTAVFTMEAVVPTSKNQAIGGFILGQTTLLYIARGEVRAGVNLGELKAESVQVTGNQIRLLLPVPRILDSKIDVSRSTVYDYDRGFLGLGPDVAPELQAQAEQQALQKIFLTACNEGILTQANERARLVVTQLLSTAGYREVTVDTQPVPLDACSTPSATSTLALPTVAPTQGVPAPVTPSMSPTLTPSLAPTN